MARNYLNSQSADLPQKIVNSWFVKTISGIFWTNEGKIGIMPSEGNKENVCVMQPRVKFKLKPEKVLEAILYLVHKKPGIDHYKLVKLLYLADKEHLNRYGRPITFDTYLAMDYGPVGSLALDLSKQNKIAMNKFGIKKLPFRSTLFDEKYYILDKPEREPIRKKFSKSDLNLLDEVLEKFGDWEFREFVNYTHNHFAYKNAWDNKPKREKRVEMAYEDFLELDANKEEKIENLENIAAHI